MLAYCHSKQHLIKNFAQKLIYYGYAGLQSHFTYRSLLAATKGSKSSLHDEANADAWMTKLYKFEKMAEVFRVALSKPGPALQLKLEDEILTQVKKDEANIIDWLSKRITNTNDWPYKCVLKDADDNEKNTLIIWYQKIIKFWSSAYMNHGDLFAKEPWKVRSITRFKSERTYVRAPRGKLVKNQKNECEKLPAKDYLMIVSYYPNPCCGAEKKVFVSWIKVTSCFYENYSDSTGGEINCHEKRNEEEEEDEDDEEEEKCEFYGSKEMLDTASTFDVSERN